MKAFHFVLFSFIVIANIACQQKKQSQAMTIETYKFDLQGHRGARGILPENSLEAFQKAMALGVNTLELDVVISKDAKVVVSHEAYMNPDICLKPDGTPVESKSEYNLYQMTYEEIKQFDCGSRQHPDFKAQKTLSTYKPLLSEVIQLSTKNLREEGMRPSLNIELKSDPKTDGIYHPEPKAFVDLVVKTVKGELIPTYKIVFQSFDERIIRYLIDEYPEYQVAYLVEDGKFYDNLLKLGKTPQIYSPLFTLLDSLQIQQAHDSGIKVIPWTVNEVSEMQKLLKMGVDGIITDYPNKAKALHKTE